MIDIKYCMQCGHHLEIRHQEHEGEQPFCPACKAFRYHPFSVAVSIIVVHPEKDKVLLIQQYGRPSNILVAGYINAQENAEECVRRELREEVGLHVEAMQYIKSEYFMKTDTLMLSYTVLASDTDLSNVSDWEVDKAAWYAFDEALCAIRPASLAQRFLLNFMQVWNQGCISFS